MTAFTCKERRFGIELALALQGEPGRSVGRSAGCPRTPLPLHTRDGPVDGVFRIRAAPDRGVGSGMGGRHLVNAVGGFNVQILSKRHELFERHDAIAITSGRDGSTRLVIAVNTRTAVLMAATLSTMAEICCTFSLSN